MSGVAGRAGLKPISADRKVIQISGPLHAWLTKVKQEKERELGRQVSFTEVIEQLTAIHRPVKS